MPLEAGLLEILACPACHAPLARTPDDAELVCTGDGLRPAPTRSATASPSSSSTRPAAPA